MKKALKEAERCNYTKKYNKPVCIPFKHIPIHSTRTIWATRFPRATHFFVFTWSVF